MFNKGVGETRSELRKFGVAVGAALALLAGICFLRGKPIFPYLSVASAVFLITSLTAPGLLRPVHRVWSSVAKAIAHVLVVIMLSVLFYLVVTPIGFIARLFGKDFLHLRYEKDAPSYWILKGEAEPAVVDYEKQY